MVSPMAGIVAPVFSLKDGTEDMIYTSCVSKTVMFKIGSAC